MKLDLVWVIYRADSEHAEEEAIRTIRELERYNIKALSAKSGAYQDPYPELFASSNELPDLAIVLGGDGKGSIPSGTPELGGSGGSAE